MGSNFTVSNVAYAEKNNLQIKFLVHVVTVLVSSLDQTNEKCKYASMGIKGLDMRMKNLKTRLCLSSMPVITCYSTLKSKKKYFNFSLNPLMPEYSSDCLSKMVNVLYTAITPER